MAKQLIRIKIIGNRWEIPPFFNARYIPGTNLLTFLTYTLPRTVIERHHIFINNSDEIILMENSLDQFLSEKGFLRVLIVPVKEKNTDTGLYGANEISNKKDFLSFMQNNSLVSDEKFKIIEKYLTHDQINIFDTHSHSISVKTIETEREELYGGDISIISIKNDLNNMFIKFIDKNIIKSGKISYIENKISVSENKNICLLKDIYTRKIKYELSKPIRIFEYENFLHIKINSENGPEPLLKTFEKKEDISDELFYIDTGNRIIPMNILSHIDSELSKSLIIDLHHLKINNSNGLDLFSCTCDAIRISDTIHYVLSWENELNQISINKITYSARVIKEHILTFTHEDKPQSFAYWNDINIFFIIFKDKNEILYVSEFNPEDRGIITNSFSKDSSLFVAHGETRDIHIGKISGLPVLVILQMSAIKYFLLCNETWDL
ncbi:MAG: hypothetical protein HQK65_01045 [Desulfamplus sp.]|nr:hypothetical protein [Desulfamplus sp.]